MVARAAVAGLVAAEFQEAFNGRIVKVNLREVLAARADREAVARGLGFELTTKAETYYCPPEARRPPSRCSLVDADFLVTVRELHLDGDEARATVEVQGEVDHEAQPVWSAGWEVRLKRAGGGWSAVDVIPLWQV